MLRVSFTSGVSFWGRLCYLNMLTNGENLRQHESKFSLTVSNIASSPNMLREVKKSNRLCDNVLRYWILSFRKLEGVYTGSFMTG